MKKIITNANVVVPEGYDGYLRNGYIAFEDSIITDIGEMKNLTEQMKDGAEIIDAKNKIAIPGFVSTHSHLYSAVVRSIPHGGYETDVDFSFASWMDRFWFKMLEDKVNLKDVYAGTLINCIENIKHGYTTTSLSLIHI